jgi:hypothetical protein
VTIRQAIEAMKPGDLFAMWSPRGEPMFTIFADECDCWFGANYCGGTAMSTPSEIAGHAH